MFIGKKNETLEAKLLFVSALNLEHEHAVGSFKKTVKNKKTLRIPYLLLSGRFQRYAEYLFHSLSKLFF
jgi:hypothetical protein